MHLFSELNYNGNHLFTYKCLKVENTDYTSHILYDFKLMIERYFPSPEPVQIRCMVSYETQLD